MKKLLITSALLGFASLVSYGQATAPAQTTTTMQAGAQAAPPRQMPTPEQMAERRAKGEEKQLGLSPEQYKSVYEADLEAAKKMVELRSSGKAQPADFQAINAAKEEKLSKILTADQMTKFKAMSNRQRPMPPAGAPGAAPAQPMSK
jgi:hypothetical protein